MVTSAGKEKATRKLARRPLPAELPREIEIIAPKQESCPDCGGRLRALGEDVSVVDPDLLAHVLVSKYADHIPLYRQSEIYARTRRPLVEALKAYVLNAEKLNGPVVDLCSRPAGSNVGIGCGVRLLAGSQG